jgi:hypothetical protein
MDDSFIKSLDTKEVAAKWAERKSYLHIDVKGRDIKKLSFAGIYTVILTELVQIIMALCDSMEKAYGIKSTDSEELIKKQMDAMIKRQEEKKDGEK